MLTAQHYAINYYNNIHDDIIFWALAQQLDEQSVGRDGSDMIKPLKLIQIW